MALTSLATRPDGAPAATQAAIAPKSFADALKPRNFAEAMSLCREISKSGLTPKNLQNDPMGIYLCVEMGERMGYGIFQSLQNIAVINGKPSVYGDELLARVRRSGALEYIKETCEGSDEAPKAVCTIKRKGEPEAVREFSRGDAQKAGLWNKAGPWQSYPKRMLQMRARGFALRDVFADVLGGVISREEAEDMVDARTGRQAARPDPRRVVDAPHHAPQQAEEAPLPLVTEQDEEALQTVISAIDGAATREHLDQAGAMAKHLPAHTIGHARARFAARRRELEEAEHQQAAG